MWGFLGVMESAPAIIRRRAMLFREAQRGD
jgi:hypothetical protein